MSMTTFPSRLNLAISKQGKLKPAIIEFLESKGFFVEKDGNADILLSSNANLPDIRIQFVRAADALLLMQRKVADMAIIGSDVMIENTSGPNPRFEKPLQKLDLGIAGCGFELAVPNDKIQDFKTPQDLNGLVIATSYPNLLREWLKDNNVEQAEVFEREGDVESSIEQGLADVAADLVDTGSTLRKYELTSVFKIARTSAVCYARKSCDAATESLVNEFIRSISANDNAVESVAESPVTAINQTGRQRQCEVA